MFFRQLTAELSNALNSKETDLKTPNSISKRMIFKIKSTLELGLAGISVSLVMVRKFLD